MKNNAPLPAWLDWLSRPRGSTRAEEMKWADWRGKVLQLLETLDQARVRVINHALTPPVGFTRVFGLVKQAQVSCMGCGWVGMVGSRAHRDDERGRKGIWDARRVTLTCPRCKREYRLGIVYWPVDKRAGAGEPTRPVDALPTASEVLSLRACVSIGTEEHAPIVEGENGQMVNVVLARPDVPGGTFQVASTRGESGE